MKKFLVLAMASMMTLSVGLLSACADPAGPGGVKPDGTISGNYKEPTRDELSAALSHIETDQVVGDTQSADWALHLGASLEAGFSFTVGEGESALTGSGKADLEAALSLEKNEDNTSADLAGLSATINEAKVTLPGDDGKPVAYSAEGGAYVDTAGTAYADLTLKGGEDELTVKGKDSLSDLLQLIGGLVSSAPMAGYSLLSEQAQDGTGEISGEASAQLFSADELLEVLAQYSVKLEMDDSEGLKFRLTASAETVAKIMEEQNVEADLAFTQCNIVLYVALDESYMLQAVSLVADVEGSVAANAALMMPAVSFEANLKLSFGVEEKSSVKVPADLDSYTESIIGQLMGNQPAPGEGETL